MARARGMHMHISLELRLYCSHLHFYSSHSLLLRCQLGSNRGDSPIGLEPGFCNGLMRCFPKYNLVATCNCLQFGHPPFPTKSSSRGLFNCDSVDLICSSNDTLLEDWIASKRIGDVNTGIVSDTFRSVTNIKQLSREDSLRETDREM